jgi:endonuclease YncB( thermonuclease family)
MRRLVVGITLGLALVVSSAPPSMANWWEGLTAWEGATVLRVVDGDTLIVRNHETGTQDRIRLLGINAPEIPTSAHPGECGGLTAKQILMDTLPVGTQVRLLSTDRNSKGKAQRPQRVVLAQNPRTGEFDQDIGWGMAERGYGLWFTVAKEPTMSPLYRRVIADAQSKGLGMWSGNTCGTEVDQPGALLEIRLHQGRQNRPLNDEWVVVRNNGAQPVDISGWTLRDSSNSGSYVFPGGSYLVPGDYRVVHSGTGTASLPEPRDVYASHRNRVFPYVGQDAAQFGDGAYLIDRNGNYRFWREYPCTTDCQDDPYKSALVIDDLSLGEKKGKKRAQTQWVRLLNRGSATHCLDGYRIETGNTRYSFQPGTCLAPGSTWTLNVGRPPRGVLVDYSTADFLRSRTPALWASGSVSLLTDQDRVIAKRSW